MSALADISIPLLPDRYYHVFNQGNEKRLIFFQEKNYQYFLNKYAEYMHDYVDTFAYCLLDNHFHLFIKIKSHEEIMKAATRDFSKIDKGFYDRYVMAWLRENSKADLARTTDLTVFEKLSSLIPLHTISLHDPSSSHPKSLETLDFLTQLCSHLVSERMRRFLLSYSKSINASLHRSGSLFQKAFRRKNLSELKDFKKLVAFIHCNSYYHSPTIDYKTYNWSSFLAISQTVKTKIHKDIVISWFQNSEDFFSFHDQEFNIQYKNLSWHLEYA